jgi:ABC-2 type transport system permease protein
MKAGYKDFPENDASNASGTATPISERIRRVQHLVRKEFIQVRRNRQNLGLVLFAPILQLLVFGFASRLDVRDVTMVVADMDRSAMSRQVIDAFSRSGYFRIVGHVASYDEVDRFLVAGDATMALLIPPDLERRIKGNRTAQVGILVDGVETTTANTVSGYAQSILRRFSLDITNERTNRMQGLLYSSSTPRLIVPSAADASRAWFNPNLLSKDFFVSGVLVLITLSYSIITTSVAIVREKEMGTIEQLMVTPVSRLELILGKTIPCFMLGVFSLSVITPLAFLIFDIPLRGSLLFFACTSVIFLITTSAIGITISTFCRTQQQAVLSSFMFLQPSVLLSGYTFPIENMPTVIQYLTYINPVRYFITIVRGVFLKGTGWEVLWPNVLPILAMGILFIALASVLFKKRTD